MNKILFLFFALFPRLALAYDTATIEQVEEFGLAISSGGYHSCVLTKSCVTCWGDNQSRQLKVPELTHPRQISSGTFHICALDDSGVQCWGNNLYGQLKVPVLSHPRYISAGEFHTCALDDSGVKCWGDDRSGQLKVPVLSNPREVSVGASHSCALDDSGVKCWGGNGWDKLKLSLSHPHSLASGRNHACAIDDSGVRCWGNNKWEQLNAPVFQTPPQQVFAGGNHNCILDHSKVKCWGDNGEGQTFVPQLSHPRLMSLGVYHSCALDDAGITCWGNNDKGQIEVPDLNIWQSFFDLYSLEGAYQKLSGYLYQDKKMILEHLAAAIQKSPVNQTDELSIASKKGTDRLLSMYFLESLLQETHSEFVQRKILPGLIFSKSEWSKRFGVSNIQQIELTPGVIEVSFTIIVAGLQSAKNYLSDPERSELESLILAIAQAKSPDPEVSAGKLIAVLEQYHNLLAKLFETERTVAFGRMIVEVQSYLKGQRTL